VRNSTAGRADRFPASVSKSTFPYLLVVAFGLTLLASLRLAQVDPRAFFTPGTAASVARFVGGMFPPKLDPEFLHLMLRPATETIQISVMGTVIAVVIAIPLGLLATSSLTWRGILHERRAEGGARWLGVAGYGVSRAVLSVFRSIPEYVWAFMFVRAVGLGPFPGVLAIGVAYGGMLGKVYSEILEGADPGPLEALRAGGATRLGVIAYGLMPQALPNLVSYTLYRWECAIRASAILGFVGAGGLGQQIELSMRMFQFDEFLTLIGMLLVLVTAVDVVSGQIRRRLVR